MNLEFDANGKQKSHTMAYLDGYQRITKNNPDGSIRNEITLAPYEDEVLY